MRKTLLYIVLLTLVYCRPKTERKAGICISFDDRSVKEWYAMAELLRKYRSRATFFVTQFDSLDSTDIRMLKELELDGNEIASHGAMHSVSEHYIREHGYREYVDKEIDAGIASMKRNGFNPKSFAYPYGAKYWFTDFILLRKFKILRDVEPMNNEKDLTLIDRIYYTYNGDRTLSSIGIDNNVGITNEMVDRAIQRALAKKEVLMLYGHSPTAQENGYHFDTVLLEHILCEADRNKLQFFTFEDLTKTP